MDFMRSHLRNLLAIWSKSTSSLSRRHGRRRRLAAEILEDRRLLAGGLTLHPLPYVTLSAGAPLQIAVNAVDTNGYPVTYSVSSTNPTISASLSTTHPDWVLNVTHVSSGFPGDSSFSGTMVIELFADQTPNTVARIVNMTNQGFYNGTSFYRVAKNNGMPFVIQGGDFTKPVAAIDDEFTAALRYTSDGLVGMPRTTNHDTNRADLFITGAAEPFLDYQYTLFGRVVSDINNLRAMIQSVPTNNSNAPGDGSPLSPVTITSASIVEDSYDRNLPVSAPFGASGSGTVTITAVDGHGGFDQTTLNVTIQPDANDPAPFLLNITPPVTTVNTPVSFQLPCFDLHGDPVTFYGPTELTQFSQFGISPTEQISSNLHFSVNSGTGAVTVTPTNGLVGVQPMFFGVAQAPNSPISALPDTQMVPLLIDPAAPTGVSLLPESDTGISDHDRVTLLNNADSADVLKFSVTGVTPGDTVVLFDGTQQIGSAVAQSSTVVVTTDGSHVLSDGLHSITAKQILANQSYTVGNASGTVDLASPLTSPLSLRIDTVAPMVSIPSLGPNPLSSPVDSMSIAFSKIVGGFNLSALTLTCNGGGNLLGPGQSLDTSDGQTFTLHNLAGLTNTFGTYVLTLNSGGSAITDVAGNPLAAGASASFIVGSSLQVTNSLDSGAGSFRQMLADAGASAGAPTIEFALPAGPQAISLLTPLPANSNPLNLRFDATQNVTVILPTSSAWINNGTLSVAGSGTLSVDGFIEGAGHLTVNTGSAVAANHIVQNGLVIGGAAGSHATVAIATSDASGNPMAPLLTSNSSNVDRAPLPQALLEGTGPSDQPVTAAFALPAGPQTINLLSQLPTPVGVLNLEVHTAQNVAADHRSAIVFTSDGSLVPGGAGRLGLGGGIDGIDRLSVYPWRAFSAQHIIQSAPDSEAAIDAILADGELPNTLDELLSGRGTEHRA
jgi:cyclophilin family peptidyl-prolyl cis-trans isomerase